MELNAELQNVTKTIKSEAYANALILEGVAPYIGTNGNWYVYNVDTKAYTDTGVKAEHPTKTSQLTNDSGFVTDAYHDDTKVNKIEGKGLSTNGRTARAS